jgi:hypothetical protein
MSNYIKILALSFCISTAILHNAFSVSAEANGIICVVEGVNDGWVILNNGCAAHQNVYRSYSGQENILVCGDVIRIKAANINPSSPGTFVFDEKSSISYLGKSKEYFFDSIKMLSLSDNKTRIWKDADGNEYRHVFYDQHKAGYQYTIDPVSFAVGDRALCAVDDKEVVTIAGFCGDANSDDTVDIMDVIKTNKHLLGAETLEGYGKLAADCDGDGTITSNDSLLLLKTVLEISDSDDVIS